MTRRVERDSRRLSWLLRHGARNANLTMDSAGWASVSDVLAVLGMTRDALDRAVVENDKGRLQLDGQRIRACQGHSTDGVPVQLEALEGSWERVEATTLWHGTSLNALRGIAQAGINAGTRTHVHLADHVDSKVGKRSNVDALLEIDATCLAATGIHVFRAPNGVLLARHVPATAITDVLPFRASPIDVHAACAASGLPCST
jgi:putative RNA 2'-phosphotransferase